MRRGMRSVLDKDGLAPRLLAAIEADSTAPARPNPGELVEKVHDFLYHCLLAAKKAARGELFVALQAINCYLQRQLFELIQVHDDLVRGRSTAWYGARMMELRADKATIAGLAATCAGYEPTSIRGTLDATIALHRALAGDVFDRLGLIYPDETETRVRAMIAAIELTRPADQSRA